METPHATPAQLRLLELQKEETLLNAARIQGFFQFLNFSDPVAFDRCLGRSGKSPDCLSRAPDGGPTPRKYATITTSGQNRKIRQQAASRSVIIMAQRKEPAALTAEETLARLKNVFLAYTDPMLYAHTGRREMNIVGFLRLMRDCRLLDNRLTLVAADVIFTRVDAGAEAEAGKRPDPGDMHVDYEGLMRCLRAVVRVKFPKATDAQEAMLLLARKWVLPFARDSGGGGGVANSVDGLFSRSTMNLVRKYDSQLKKLFAWYSSMDETDPSRVTWSWARDHGGAINSSQFILMLLNFSVLPVLLSKRTALEVFVHCEAANDGDERANAMYYPAFLETLAEVALEVGKYSVARMRAATSPDDLKLLRHYAEGCPAPHGPHMMQVYNDVLTSRGRDASTLDQHALYDAATIKRKNETQMVQQLEQQTLAHATDVVQRREGMRQRFALTRLRNFYRDVRTFNNNSTWPPERDVSPATHRNNPGPGAGSGSEADGVHVAFYDSERAIKTPKPVWMPVGLANNRRYSHAGPDLPTPSGAAAGIKPGSALPNYLLLESPSGAAAKQSSFSPTGAGGPRLSIFTNFVPSSAGGYIRSPKPYQLKVSIEDRDEHEAILDLASRLPYIHVPSAGALAGGPEASASLASTGIFAANVPCHGTGKPRAVTAPAELNRRRRGSYSEAGSPGASGAAAAGDEEAFGEVATGGGGGGGGAFGPEPSTTSTATNSKQRLPPVQHQLHRAQATAAALTVLAGGQPPNPYQLGSTGQLPPALAASALQSSPSTMSTAGFLSNHHHHQHHYGGPGLEAPQPSSLSVGGAFSPNSSQRFSPHASLKSRKQSQRKRGEVGGLPNLKLPDETGPSVDVVAALDELDRFDDARVAVGGPRSRGARDGPAGLEHQQPWLQELAQKA